MCPKIRATACILYLLVTHCILDPYRICLFLGLSVHLLRLSIRLFIRSSVCPFVCSSVHPFVWPGWRAGVTTFVNRCEVCVQRQKVNLEDCEYVSRLYHRQGEVVLMVGPVSTTISKDRYVLTMMDGFSRFVKVVPLKTKSAKEVSEAVMSGGIKKSRRVD